MKSDLRYFKKINLLFIVLFLVFSLGYTPHPINSPGNNGEVKFVNGNVQTFLENGKAKDRLEVLVTQILDKVSTSTIKVEKEKEETTSLFWAWYINALRNEHLRHIKIALSLSIMLTFYKIIECIQDKDGPKNKIPQLIE